MLLGRVIDGRVPVKKTSPMLSLQCRSSLSRAFLSIGRLSSLSMEAPSAPLVHPLPILPRTRDFSSGPRRRRGQSGGPPSSSSGSGDAIQERAVNRPVKETDILKFAVGAQEFLDKMELALEPMKRANEIFVVTRQANSLTITLPQSDGEYSLEIDEDSQSIFMQSPLSGKFCYVLSAVTGEWVNQEDGHSLEGMMVRDLIRQCNGVPKL